MKVLGFWELFYLGKCTSKHSTPEGIPQKFHCLLQFHKRLHRIFDRLGSSMQNLKLESKHQIVSQKCNTKSYTWSAENQKQNCHDLHDSNFYWLIRTSYVIPGVRTSHRGQDSLESPRLLQFDSSRGRQPLFSVQNSSLFPIQQSVLPAWHLQGTMSWALQSKWKEYRGFVDSK